MAHVEVGANDPTREVFLGVDAGNSKTVAVLVDAAGRVLGYGRAGRGDIYSAPTEEHAVTEVVRAVDAAFTVAARSSGAPLGLRDVRHAAFCLAGLDWPADFQFWRAQVHGRLPDLRHYSLHNDGFALLRAGEPTGLGVALSAGTGGAVVSRGVNGVEWSASFWIVDPLGGAMLGAAAYAAVIRAELGIGPATALTPVVLARHGYRDVAAMLEARTSRGGHGLAEPALARDVLDAAQAGDEVAVAIVHRQADALTAYADAAARQVGLEGRFPVVLGGSVLSSSNPVLRQATIAALAVRLPGAVARLTPRSPVVGAAAEALAEGTGTLAPETVDRLTTHRFPEEFLLT